MGVNLTHTDLDRIVDHCCGGLAADAAADRAFAPQPNIGELRAKVADAIDELRLCLCAAKDGRAMSADECDWMMIEAGRMHNYWNARKP